MHRSLARAALLGLTLPLLFAASLAQGKVWVVDDDGGAGVDFTELWPAVSAAADGDVLLVKTGSYGDLALYDRALTVVADAGAGVQVGRVSITQLGAGRTTTVSGIAGLTARIWQCAGTVWIESSTFEQPTATGPSGDPGVLVEASAGVVLVDVTARGQATPFIDGATYVGYPHPGEGVRIHASTVAMFGCEATGGLGSYYRLGLFSGTVYAGSSADGLQVDGDADVHATKCAFVGADGLVTSECWYYGSPGSGVHAVGIGGVDCPNVALQSCTATGGIGASGSLFYPCAKGPDGPAISTYGCATVVDVPIAPMAMSAASPVREHSVVDVNVAAPPGSPVVLGVSTTPDAVHWPALGAPLALSPVSPVLVVALGVTPASGALVVSLPLHGLPSGWDSAVFFGQGLYVDPFNQPVLGGARALVLLDDSL